MPTLDEIRRIQEKRGIEFYFAQFVDMYARPSAKLIPAAHLDALVSDGAGFAGCGLGVVTRSPRGRVHRAAAGRSGARRGRGRRMPRLLVAPAAPRPVGAGRARSTG